MDWSYKGATTLQAKKVLVGRSIIASYFCDRVFEYHVLTEDTEANMKEQRLEDARYIKERLKGEFGPARTRDDNVPFDDLLRRALSCELTHAEPVFRGLFEPLFEGKFGENCKEW